MTNREEVDLLCKTLRHPAEYRISFYDILEIKHHIEGGYQVSWIEPPHNNTDIKKSKDFVHIRKAVKFFVDLRHKFQLGSNE